MPVVRQHSLSHSHSIHIHSLLVVCVVKHNNNNNNNNNKKQIDNIQPSMHTMKHHHLTQ